MTVTLYKWTLDRYHTAIEAGVFEDQAVELLRGDIVVTDREREPHACYSSEGAEYFRSLLGDRAAIRETKPITLPDNSEPVPDVTIVQPPLRRYLSHHPAPDEIFWILEYAQTSLTKDLGLKKDVYAEAGIQEYWVSEHLKNARLNVFRNLSNGTYQTELTLMGGTLAPLAFPDITITVERLFS